MWILISLVFIVTGFFVQDTNYYFIGAIFALADSIHDIAKAIKDFQTGVMCDDIVKAIKERK